MPDRYLTPRRSTYLLIGLAFCVIVLGIRVVNLSGRVGQQEALRRSEAKSAAARQQLGCVIFSTIEEVSVEIPLMNLNAILDGNTLTPEERREREKARARYLVARKKLAPSLQACTR